MSSDHRTNHMISHWLPTFWRQWTDACYLQNPKPKMAVPPFWAAVLKCEPDFFLEYSGVLMRYGTMCKDERDFRILYKGLVGFSEFSNWSMQDLQKNLNGNNFSWVKITQRPSLPWLGDYLTSSSLTQWCWFVLMWDVIHKEKVKILLQEWRLESQ